jgi:hypothetical protein
MSAANTINFAEKIEGFRVAERDRQIVAREDELNKILGACMGYQLGEIKVDAEDLIDMIKNDILGFLK